MLRLSKTENPDEGHLKVLQRAIESITDYAIFLLDTQGQVKTWNQGAEHIKGYKAAEIIGQSFTKFYTQEAVAQHYPEHILEQAKTKGHFEDEGWRVRKDGSKFWANVVITPIYDKQGTHTGFVKVTRNLTERKKFEKALQEKNLALEKAIKDLLYQTDELISLEKLLAEQKTRASMAEEYHRKQTEFIHTICHEIRNPLNGIYGVTSLMREKLTIIEETYLAQCEKKFRETLKELEGDIEIIEDCSCQEKFIVDDVLDLSRLEYDKIKLNPTPFSLKKAFNDFIRIYRPQLTQKNLDVFTNLPDEDVWLMADTQRLSQIVTNLLSNAIKFTPEKGQIFLKVSCEALVNDACKLIVTVKDTGIGITEVEKSNLFNAFPQANARITNQYDTSNLGLVICKKLVERMGGSITVESQKDQGTQFTFFIICQQVSEQAKAEATNETMPKKRHHGEPGNDLTDPKVTQHILIAEDNVINQKLLKLFLEQRGYICQIANNGAEALERYKQFHFDLICMDVEMPIMGGLEAAQKIRQIESENDKPTRIPILGLSGNASKEQIEYAKKNGMDEYLTKPYVKENLYRMIEKLTAPDSPFIKKQKSVIPIETTTSASKSSDSPASLLSQSFLFSTATTNLVKPQNPSITSVSTVVQSQVTLTSNSYQSAQTPAPANNLLFFKNPHENIASPVLATPLVYSPIKALIEQCQCKVSEFNGSLMVSLFFAEYPLAVQLQQALKIAGIKSMVIPGQVREINVLLVNIKSSRHETYSIDLTADEYKTLVGDKAFEELLKREFPDKENLRKPSI